LIRTKFLKAVMKIKMLIIGGLLALTAAGCYNDKADKLYPAAVNTTCDTTTVTFAADIEPIIMANCAISGGCHDAAGAATTSGFNFVGYTTDLTGQAYSGRLIADITGASGNPMPKNAARLSDCDINKFIRWVNQGFQNN